MAIGGLSIGVYANALLLDPAGFGAVWNPADFNSEEQKEMLGVVERLGEILPKEGFSPEIAGRLAVQAYTLSRYINGDTLGLGAHCAAEIRNLLLSIPQATFKRAAGRLMVSQGMRFAIDAKAWARAMALCQKPKKPWLLVGPTSVKEARQWADRLKLAGRTEEAKVFYKKEGEILSRKASKLFQKSFLLRSKNDGPRAEHLAMEAEELFILATWAFERGESRTDKIKAANQADYIGEKWLPKVRGFWPGGLTANPELIGHARRAAMGSAEEMEIFLAKAGGILSVKPQDILEALAEEGRIQLFESVRTLLGNQTLILNRLIRIAQQRAAALAESSRALVDRR